MIFNWFNSSEAEQFGLSVANYFSERIPPTLLPTNDKKSLRKASEVTTKVLSQVQVFRKEHSLNTFQKAKLAKTIQNELLSRGYDTGVVVDLVNLLVRSL